MEKLRKKLVYLLVFSALALTAYKINFSTLIGVENQSFTFFQFLGPVGAQIFSPLLGVLGVVLVQAANFFLAGKALEPMTVIRFLPMMFAALYFGTKRKEIVLLPLAAIALFVLHPEGSQAWFFSLYWLIPVAAFLFFKDNLFANSLGATFTAHAIGSVAFLYAFNIPAATWLALIPVVAFERGLFALGIAGSTVALNTALDKLSHLVDLKALNVEPRYVLSLSKPLSRLKSR